MKSVTRTLSLISALALVAAFAMPGTALADKTRLGFGGGPEGGTFQYFSNGIASRLSKMLTDVEVSNMASAGSVENVRRANSGEIDFGIGYSGDTYLARNGRLTNDTTKYPNVHAMAFLYGAPAHLIVLEGSGINAVADLVGKRIAVEAQHRGLIVRPIGHLNVLSPPLVLTREEIDTTVTILRESIEATMVGLERDGYWKA